MCLVSKKSYILIGHVSYKELVPREYSNKRTHEILILKSVCLIKVLDLKDHHKSNIDNCNLLKLVEIWPFKRKSDAVNIGGICSFCKWAMRGHSNILFLFGGIFRFGF